MKSQIDLIHETEWDILIVLDAIRYDYFKKYYKSVLGEGGKLIKTTTASTYTVGWLIEIFSKKMENVIFISSEPISERIRDIDKRLKHGGNYNIKSYFDDIIEVWEDHYDEVNNLVLPEPMTLATIRTVSDNPGKRILVKYWQAHDPYIYHMDKGFKDTEYNLYIRGNFRKILYELISDETYWTVIKKLGYPPENWLANLWLKRGREGIIKGYTEDLLLVLNHAKRLINTFPNKKIVITSDHGERLGEGKRYSHGGRMTKEIKEIPWYEVH